MSISKRKLKYYNLNFSLYHNGSEIPQNPKNIIEQFLHNYDSCNHLERKMDINNNRFCFLDSSYNYDYPYLSGFFISAKTQHRPPLIDETTLSKRRNPKHLTEGEEERTHFVIKIDESTGDLILLLESRNVGITVGVIARYIKRMLRDSNIEFKWSIITKENFIDELRNLYQVKVCDIYVQKDILGSDALRFANPSENMQEEVMLTIKAKPRKSIKEKTMEIAHNFLGGTSEHIKRIKVVGVDDNKNPVTLNTTAAQQDKYVKVNLDEETKIVDSDDMLQKMREILEDF